jgi:hypothetical protein
MKEKKFRRGMPVGRVRQDQQRSETAQSSSCHRREKKKKSL